MKGMKVSPHLAAPWMSPVQQPPRQGRAQCLLGNPRVRTESGGSGAWKDPDRGADLCSCSCLTAVSPPSARRRGSWGPLCCGQATSLPLHFSLLSSPNSCTARSHFPSSFTERRLFVTSELIATPSSPLDLTPSGPAALPSGSCTFAEMLGFRGEREEGWPVWHPGGPRPTQLCALGQEMSPFLASVSPCVGKGE